MKNGQIAQVPLFKLCPNRFINEVGLKTRSGTDENDPGTSPEVNQKTYETIVSKIISENSGSNSSELLDICVDCYQMMNGITVSANQKDISNNNCEDAQRKKIKETRKNSADLTPASLKSPDSITMLPLGHINKINTGSPFFSKITVSHHSTPTPTPALKNRQSEISTIILTENSPEYGLYSESSSPANKLSRQSLTLDLLPVYTKSP